MRLNNIKLTTVYDYKQKIELLRKLPSHRISYVSSILIIKHDEDYYIVKVRGGYEDRIMTEEFDCYSKSEISYENVNEFCDKIVGKYVLIDITGWKLDL
ncbi:MAG TPA: hypothetical protein GXZ90_09815 [Clostridiales bacterium]|nr:hypothetical protein [Clostridiales bacterium]